MEPFRRLIYRASKKPTVSLPFGVRSAGHYCLDGLRLEKSKHKYFVQLFWGIRGEGAFRLDNRQYVLKPEQVFIYFTGDPHIIEPVTMPWEYRWMTLDGDMNVRTVESFGLKRGLRKRVGPCPEELFIQLEASLRDVTANGQRRAAVVAFSILARICGTSPVIRREDSAVKLCVQMIEEQYTDPALSIMHISRELGMNRSSLSRMFKKEMGCSPQEYLNLLKLQKAMSLLKETDLHVFEIAAEVGYDDPNYFARIFKKKTGLVPTAFREQ